LKSWFDDGDLAVLNRGNVPRNSVDPYNVETFTRQNRKPRRAEFSQTNNGNPHFPLRVRRP
jgi:hypothetical protein